MFVPDGDEILSTTVVGFHPTKPTKNRPVTNGDK